MKKGYLFCIAVLFLTVSVAQETINTMFYNLLEFPSASPGGRAVILRNILSEYEPDIFMICELESESGANLIQNETLNSESYQFNRAPYVANQSGTANLQQMLYYRSNMFTLESSSIILTTVRDINKYVLKLNTQDGDTDPVLIYVYVSHLKSSQGTANELQRLDMVNAVTADLETLPTDAFVLFAGDLNIYNANEPAYEELLDETNAIVLKDPIDTPGDWHNNDTFRGIHTQSTRIDSGPFGAGAGGGLDDRFDFILISENMLSNPKLQYVENSYKAFGNNGNCYNQSISNATCDGAFGQQLRNSLFSMSDHLPVVMQLQTDREIVLGGTNFVNNNTPLKLEATLVQETVTLLSEAPVPFEYAIYNVLGQKVMQGAANPATRITVSIHTLANGLYYIKTNLPFSQPLKFVKTS